MAQANWKLAAGLVGLIVVALLVQRLARRVPPFHPPPDRDLSACGFFDASAVRNQRHAYFPERSHH
jgi:hypothetical protein